MSRHSRWVDVSVAVYRLLLAAYPATFRSEYGEAMTQLFRDTARDAYHQRGRLGLLSLWWRTLLDFTSSVIRQHRQETAAASGESLSLHYLAQQWLTLASVILCVLVLSVRCALHVILSRPLRTCLVASTIILGVWLWSFYGHFRFSIRPLPIMLDCDIRGGVVEFRHIYSTGEPDLFPERFWQDPKNRNMPGEEMASLVRERYWKNPKYRSTLIPVQPWEVSYSSGYWILVGYTPLQYSLFRIPVPAFLVFVLLFYVGTRGRYQGVTRSGPAIQSA